MIISPCNQGPANYHVTRWRWSAVPAPNISERGSQTL